MRANFPQKELMAMTLRWTMSAALVAFGGATASAETAIEAAFDYQLTCCETPACCDEPSCCAEPSCGCDDGCCGDGLCGDGCGDACGCGSTCGLGLGGGGCSLLGDCCLGDAYALKDCVDPCGCCPIDFGGWTQFGFHTDNIR
ncbi:MAG: hypothetical protein RIC11_15555, partial [Botrimarina sp.]